MSVPKELRFKLKLWGAGGGGGQQYPIFFVIVIFIYLLSLKVSNQTKGGSGGFASAEYIAQIGEELQVNVGKGGTRCTTNTNGQHAGAGESNGGNGDGNYNSGGGGGSSHIISPLLVTFIF